MNNDHINQPKRVGIWIRVSTDRQVEGESPEHHEQRARYYILSKVDWQIVEVYRLDAMSGKSVMDYPETKRMLADVKSGHITGLVFSKLARLARNLRELIDIANYFKQYNADIISLAEAIDTSTAGGRLVYNMIGAVAEFERDETAERVAASVPIRAKLGKSLGGQAPFGYKWDENNFVVNPAEAPVRKLMYEIFLQKQRQLATARELNNLGYRTRNGSKFSATSVFRLIQDTTAKGIRRANYTKSPGKNLNWSVKPESEWIYLPCEAIVSEQLWNDCNAILDAQTKHRTPGPKAVYLLSGFVHCSCGKVMYVYDHSKTYVCRKCKVRIAVADLDEIYQQYLKEYLGGISHADYMEQSDKQLTDCKKLYESSVKERGKLSKRLNDLLELRLDGSLTKERYMEQYQPLEERLQQLDIQLPQLEAEIDVRTIQVLSGDTMVKEAQTLHDRWHELTFEQKRTIVETITTNIEVGKEDITITLAYAPPLSPNSGENFTPPQGFILATSINELG